MFLVYSLTKSIDMSVRSRIRSGFSETCAPVSDSALLAAAATNGRINLTGRGLTCFPAGVLNVGAENAEWWLVEPTTHVDLSFNPLITKLPREIASLAETLLLLKLRGCGLTSVPDELGMCIFLRCLDLADNKLSELPESLATLPALVQIDLSGNIRLSALPPRLAGLCQLESLRASGCGLRSLPTDVGACTRLVDLNVSRNALTHLPHSLRACTALAHVDVSRNALTSLDASGWPALATLDVSCNALRPNSINLKQVPSVLREIRLSDNHDLGGGGGEGVPAMAIADPLFAALGRAPALELLAAAECGLTVLPAALRFARALAVIDVRNNSISLLPPWIGWIPALRACAVDGNPLRSLKRSLIAPPAVGGEKAAVGELTAFLRTRATPEEAALYDGEANAAAAGASLCSALGGGMGGGRQGQGREGPLREVPNGFAQNNFATNAARPQKLQEPNDWSPCDLALRAGAEGTPAPPPPTLSRGRP